MIKPSLEDVLGKVAAKIDADQIKVPVQAATDHTKIATALERITKAGFTVTMHPGDKLVVSPRAKLSDAQVAWITANKPAILAYLLTHTQEPAVEALKTAFKATIKSVAIGTPPEPQKSLVVSCGACLHGQRYMPGDELGGYRL